MVQTERSKPKKGMIIALADRFRGSLNSENKNQKTDSKQVQRTSPVSILKRPKSVRFLLPTASSSSSSSGSGSGSVSGETVNTSGIRSDDGAKSDSGDQSGSGGSSPIVTESERSAPATPNPKPVHRESHSAVVVSPSSLVPHSPKIIHDKHCKSPKMVSLPLLPVGNICPSGKRIVTGMNHTPRNEVLGSGIGNYGYGTIIRRRSEKPGSGEASLEDSMRANPTPEESMRRAMESSKPEEVRMAGNEQYKMGKFSEAVTLYDRAIMLSPEDLVTRSNKAAALIALGRLYDAMRECFEALRVNALYEKAHQRLALLYLRFGQTISARKHVECSAQKPDQAVLKMFKAMDLHLERCTEARKKDDWESALKETDAAIAAGADCSAQLFTCRVEALLKLHRVEDADWGLSKIPYYEAATFPRSQTKFFGFHSEAYLHFVRALVDMALGRFNEAIAAADTAAKFDYLNTEITRMQDNARMVARARARGNDLFQAGKFAEACSAYDEGLNVDIYNSVLYYNRATSYFKIGLLELSIEDCNKALRIRPNYTKARFRRAALNRKLERWAACERDYAILRKKLPGDNEVAEALIHAQVALKYSPSGEVQTMKLDGEMEKVSGLPQFKASISSRGFSIAYFSSASNKQCEQLCNFVGTLHIRYPIVNFVEVDVEESPEVAEEAHVAEVPAFRVYKSGSSLGEVLRPTTLRALIVSLSQYGL